jgi:hypothetical protein
MHVQGVIKTSEVDFAASKQHVTSQKISHHLKQFVTVHDIS